MTIWDLYAAAALQGLLAGEANVDIDMMHSPGSAADAAAKYADAMCIERAKRDGIDSHGHDLVAVTIYLGNVE